uniref:(northern house mosquito) hypothetical protein n=1 Tax=Culex pipiens TaxID=7175 RepID=A0A8D8AIJ3_CULPI
MEQASGRRRICLLGSWPGTFPLSRRMRSCRSEPDLVRTVLSGCQNELSHVSSSANWPLKPCGRWTRIPVVFVTPNLRQLYRYHRRNQQHHLFKLQRPAWASRCKWP